MAARDKKEPKINLLPQEEFAQSTLGRILKWLLTSFRLIVIATEMVVMIAFLSRFWLDAQISDLTDAIAQKTSVIVSYAQTEKSMLEAQKQLSIFSALAYDKSKYLPLLQTITTQLPQDVQVTSLTIDSNQLQLRATTSSETSASTFMLNLKNTGLFDKTIITQVSIDQTTNLISFQVLATFKAQTESQGGANGT